MPSNTKNVKMGVCQIAYGGVDLGYTQGGVEVTVATNTKEVTVDQFGSAPINEIIMGRTCTASVPLAETTLRNMVKIMPGAVLVGSGGVAATGTVTFVTAPPVDGDKVTVNGVDFTFKTTPNVKNSNEMAIQGTINLCASVLAAAINASLDPAVSQISASAATAVVTISADDQGVAGNAVTLAKQFVTSANCTVSGATLSGGIDPTDLKVTVPTGIGISLLDFAKELTLHPIANGETDRSDDFVMPIAATAGGLKFAYKIDTERVFDCTFKAYPDSNTKILFVVGDKNAA